MTSPGDTTTMRTSSDPNRPQGGGPAARPAPRAGRRVRLMVSRVDPFSVMKVGFLVSVAMGIAFVVMTAVLWMLMGAMGVFDTVNELAGQILGEGSGTEFDIMDFVGFGRVLSLSIIVAVIDVVLMTAIVTLGAFLYNIVASLVGGIHMTLTDD
ncbi:DUF3566 domain-containing protein [Janibacter cremeus]|uniref:DUF3566 domain-containing protein n=1 Tax=Janibacter cremeus TaxID=1285192 RepID=UPI0023F6F6DF|nr:DUF3566 domain-containing protein [Janibacter cremeus]WEV77433.1 DUF3566 domain-containing protein [Janibacter cremeus]